MIAMLYEAVGVGASCRWLNGQDLFGQFRDGMDAGRAEEDILRKLTAPDVLAVSDPIPPVGCPTSFNVNTLYRVFDRRYRALKPTWISMNALSPDDADNKLSEPVFDRVREAAEMFHCFWPSYRERTGKKRTG
jgi:DNA replication protein DnaC